MKKLFTFFLLLLALKSFGQATIDNIHFLIPGGTGGGWDTTARDVGEVLNSSGIVKKISYENMSGLGGSKAISYLIETATKQKNTLMVNSTPIVISSLQKIFFQSFKDLTLVASIIADYQVLAVRADSPLKNWHDVLEKFKENPRALKIGGGSSRGSMDHIVSAQIFKAAGFDPKEVKYIAFDAGGKAFNALLNNEIEVLSTGLGEVINQHKNRKIRIIGVTSNDKIKELNDIPTFKSLGVNMSFANWRGFFAAPGIQENRIEFFTKTLEKMYQTKQWEETRKRNGWRDLFRPNKEFKKLLETQEKEIGSLMEELGFL